MCLADGFDSNHVNIEIKVYCIKDLISVRRLVSDVARYDIFVVESPRMCLKENYFENVSDETHELEGPYPRADAIISLDLQLQVVFVLDRKRSQFKTPI